MAVTSISTLLLAAIGAAPAVPPGAAEAGFFRIVFQEEFVDPAQLVRRWTPHAWFDPADRIEEPLVVANGVGTFTAPPAPLFRGGRMTSWPYATFQYGYFEARMRWPATEGNWAAFWLFGADSARAGRREDWPASCEIDIAEALGGRGYHSTVHEWHSADAQSDLEKRANKDVLGYDTSTWHTYGASWTASRISFYFDGQQVNSVETPAVCRDRDLIMIVGAQRYDAIGQSVDVDWVRVWQ